MFIFIFNTHDSQSDYGEKWESDRICYFHLFPRGIYVQSSDKCFHGPIFAGKLTNSLQDFILNFLVTFFFSCIKTTIKGTHKLNSHHLTFARFKSCTLATLMTLSLASG